MSHSLFLLFEMYFLFKKIATLEIGQFGNMAISEYMAFSEIWYAFGLIRNRVVGNIAVEKIVIGKKSRRG